MITREGASALLKNYGDALAQFKIRINDTVDRTTVNSIEETLQKLASGNDEVTNKRVIYCFFEETLQEDGNILLSLFDKYCTSQEVQALNNQLHDFYDDYAALRQDTPAWLTRSDVLKVKDGNCVMRTTLTIRFSTLDQKNKAFQFITHDQKPGDIARYIKIKQKGEHAVQFEALAKGENMVRICCPTETFRNQTIHFFKGLPESIKILYVPDNTWLDIQGVYAYKEEFYCSFAENRNTLREKSFCDYESWSFPLPFPCTFRYNVSHMKMAAHGIAQGVRRGTIFSVLPIDILRKIPLYLSERRLTPIMFQGLFESMKSIINEENCKPRDAKKKGLCGVL